MQIILASTSTYRKQLLERLGLDFDCLAPQCDEEALKQELAPQALEPEEIAMALARAKCLSIAEQHPEAIVIGSDQLAHVDGQILDKPGSVERALQQLQRMNGRSHELLTAVVISHGGEEDSYLDRTVLHMARHDDAALQRYIDRDQPLDCAGAYKIEAAGISLFRHIESKDHSAISGLPLLFVAEALRHYGCTVP